MQTAVVTGAGRGIGREIARRLAARGFAVLATDIDQSAAAETAEMIGANAWGKALDVRDAGAHSTAAAEAAERGPLKVWVNNAGILRTQKAWEHPEDDIRLMVDANLLGVIWGSRAAVEQMRSGGGEILNMASMSAFGAVPGLAVYGATKHAVRGFSMSLQGDLADAGFDIRVHALCPDGVDTGMVQERAGDEDSAIIWSGPRLLTAEEVAEQAVDLLGTSEIFRTYPRRRGILVRAMAPFPRPALKLTPLFKKVGEKKRSQA